MEKDNPLNVTGRDEGDRGKDWSVYGYTPRATPGYLSSSWRSFFSLKLSAHLILQRSVQIIKKESYDILWLLLFIFI